MTWVTFDSLESFNAWHEQLKCDLGIPLPALDASGNQVEGQVSTEYTTPWIISETDIRADVEEVYLAGLTLSKNPSKDSDS
jgi:hypothetical protein